jgi:hypothetical protein
MRTVDVKWQNLAAGVNRAEKLEAELKELWAPRIRDVRSSRFQRALDAWEARQEPKRRQFEQDLSAWRVRQEERARELDVQRGAWQQALSKEKQRLMDLARRGGLVGLPVFVLVAAVLALLGARLSSFVLAALAVFGLALGPALLAGKRLADLRSKDPAFRRSEEPEPEFTPDKPKPQPARRNPVALDIGRQWWKEIAYELAWCLDAAGAAVPEPANEPAVRIG